MVAIVTPSSARTGVVLSGGGARGAYEAGVIAGIVDILASQGRKRAPFSIFTGTSVGAINATWLAAHADRPDMNVSGLLERWRSLDLREHEDDHVCGGCTHRKLHSFPRSTAGGKPDPDRVGSRARLRRDPSRVSGAKDRVRALLRWRNPIQHAFGTRDSFGRGSLGRRVGVASRGGR